MSEQQASYTTPVYPDVLVLTNAPACCLCGGAMVVQDDLDVCSGCGSRRVRPQAKAAATPPDIAALRALFDEVLTDLQSTYLASSDGSDTDRTVMQDDIDDYRARLDALLGEG